MKGNKIFNSQIKEVGRFCLDVGNKGIKNEPMFFNCDYSFAYENGGEITRSFLEALPDSWKNAPLVFDSRVHMLFPEWCPAICGFHHDDVPRLPKEEGSASVAGQPDYDNTSYFSEHILGLVNADICPTLFAIGEAEFNVVPEGVNVYKQWHKEVEDKLAKGELVGVEAKDRTLYQFDWSTWHTAQFANKAGWRWFGRVSRNTDRINNISNEIRVNAQVYLKHPFEGW